MTTTKNGVSQVERIEFKKKRVLELVENGISETEAWNTADAEWRSTHEVPSSAGINALALLTEVTREEKADADDDKEPADAPVPAIPKGLLDEVYALPTAPVCMVKGKETECTHVCEPGLSDKYSETVFLLPGEDLYLKARFASAGIEWKWPHARSVVVPLGKVCPYYEDKVCTIHDDRPFTCRSYPLRCHKIGQHSLSVFSALSCPFTCKSQSSNLDPHHNAWLGAWKALSPFIPDKWWVAFERGCPAGFKHLGFVLDPREKGVPVGVLKSYARAKCEHCRGSGVDPKARGVCSCIDRKVRKELSRQIGRDVNSVYMQDWEK